MSVIGCMPGACVVFPAAGLAERFSESETLIFRELLHMRMHEKLEFKEDVI